MPLPLESAAWLFSRKQSMLDSAVRQVSAECIVCARLFWQSAQRTLALTGCRPVVATNPYVIMVILVAWSWLVGLLSLAPYKCELTYVLDASGRTQRAVRLLVAPPAAGLPHTWIVASMRTGNGHCWKLAASYGSLTAALLHTDVLDTALVAEACIQFKHLLPAIIDMLMYLRGYSEKSQLGSWHLSQHATAAARSSKQAQGCFSCSLDVVSGQRLQRMSTSTPLTAAVHVVLMWCLPSPCSACSPQPHSRLLCTAHADVVFLTLITSDAVILCQYTGRPGSTGNVKYFYGRCASVAIGVLFVLLMDMILPW